MVMRLFRSKKFSRRVLIAILALILPAFVLWGVDSGRREPNVVGTIARRDITYSDLAESRNGVRIQLLLQGLTDREQMRDILANQALMNNMAWERLIFLEAARRERIRVSDEEVANLIMNIPEFQVNGQFDPARYETMLSHSFRVEPRSFEEIVRENLIVRKFRNSLIDDISVSEEEVRKYYHERNDQVILSYFTLPRDEFARDLSATDEEIRTFYENNTELFRSPARKDLVYVKEPFTSNTERALAINLLDASYDELREAEDFAKKAEELGLEVTQTGLFPVDGTIPGMRFDPQVHEEMLRLNENATSRPIISGDAEGHVYILHVARSKPSYIKSFDEVKEEAKEDLIKEKSQLEAEKKAHDIFEKILQDELSLEEAAGLLEQEIKTSGEIGRGEFIEKIGPADRIVKKAIEAGRGNLLEPQPTREGVLLAKVSEVIKADEDTFEQNKAMIEQNLLLTKQMETMQEWFDEKAPQARLEMDLDQI